MGATDPRAQIVGHHQLGAPAVELEGAHMRRRPVRQGLRPTSPRRRCSSRCRARPRRSAPAAPRRSRGHPPAPSARRSRRTASRRRGCSWRITKLSFAAQARYCAYSAEVEHRFRGSGSGEMERSSESSGRLRGQCPSQSVSQTGARDATRGRPCSKSTTILPVERMGGTVRVAAVNAQGPGDWSDEAVATPLTGVPDAPTGLTLTPGGRPPRRRLDRPGRRRRLAGDRLPGAVEGRRRGLGPHRPGGRIPVHRARHHRPRQRRRLHGTWSAAVNAQGPGDWSDEAAGMPGTPVPALPPAAGAVLALLLLATGAAIRRTTYGLSQERFLPTWSRICWKMVVVERTKKTC